MNTIPSFSDPTECRLALQMAGRVMRLESAQRFSEKVKAAKDLKTFIESFKTALHGIHKFSKEFQEYVKSLMSEVKTIMVGRPVWMKDQSQGLSMSAVAHA